MHTVSALITTAPVRIGIVVGGALVALLATLLVLRPEMMAMSMRVLHGLVPGFGL